MFTDGEENRGTGLRHTRKKIKIYLKTLGVLFRSLMEKESLPRRWRVLVAGCERMELRGELRAARLSRKSAGEQFALPDTLSNCAG